METTRTSVKIASEFKELFNPEWRYIIFHGGREEFKQNSFRYDIEDYKLQGKRWFTLKVKKYIY